MQKNPDLFDLADICAYFNLSESTIRRKVRDSREGIGNFPLPLFGAGCRILWKRCDIEAWNGESETITLNPLSVLPIPPTAQPRNATQVRKGLEALGVRFDKTNNN